MKREKRDVAETLGLKFDKYGINTNMFVPVLQFNFTFQGKCLSTWEASNINEAWEVVSSRLLEPLVELLKSKL